MKAGPDGGPSADPGAARAGRRGAPHAADRGAPRGRWTVGDALWLAVSLGLFIGLGEVTAIGWRFYVEGAVTHITPHVVWMAPVGYALLFAAIALILSALGRRWTGPRLRGPAPIVVSCLWLGLLGWTGILIPEGLHPAAGAVLALGAAAALGRAVVRRPELARLAARRVGPGLLIIVAFGAALVTAREWRAERRALAAIPAPPEDAANVLLLVLDTVRAKSLGLFGGPASVSPNLDALGASSVVFENAITTAPWTLPSHGSMFTGRWPHEQSSGWSTPLDEAHPTLPERLSELGYATAGFVANLSYVSRPYGLDRGFARYEDFPVSVGQVILAMSLGRMISTLDPLRAALNEHELLHRKTAGAVNRDLLAWLERRPERPFFAFVNYFDAHEPYEPPRRLWNEAAPGYRRSEVRHRHNLLRGVNARRVLKAEMPAEDVPRELAIYEAAIRSLDMEIGRLLDALEAEGLLDETWLIAVSDHGEQFGEHGMFEHSQSLYQPLIHVPLLIRPPGGTGASVRVGRPVSVRDLPATVVDAIGAPPSFPGHSLVPLWSASDPKGAAGDGARAAVEPAGAAGDSTGVAAEVAGAAEPTLSPALSWLSRGLVEQPWYPIARGFEMQSLREGDLFYICNPDGTEELYDVAVDPDALNNLAGSPAHRDGLARLRARLDSVGAPPAACPPPPPADPRPAVVPR